MLLDNHLDLICPRVPEAETDSWASGSRHLERCPSEFRTTRTGGEPHGAWGLSDRGDAGRFPRVCHADALQEGGNVENQPDAAVFEDGGAGHG